MAQLSSESNRIRRRPLSSFKGNRPAGGGSTIDLTTLANLWTMQQTFTDVDITLTEDNTFAMSLVDAVP